MALKDYSTNELLDALERRGYDISTSREATQAAEAALAYRGAEAISDRDPGAYLQAQIHLDACLTAWQVLVAE